MHLLTLSLFAAALTIPPVNYTHRTLSNGLEVYSIRDTSTPTVAIHVWYRVGSKDDPEHRSGFAHLFEHIMFKSTKNMKSEMMDRLTEDVGGYNNAFTKDRKSTRLNSSHSSISYAVFCLKKKKY